MTTAHGAGAGGASSSTRGLIAGGVSPSKLNTISFITIQTTGKQIGDELIVDLNQILDMDTQYHSVFVHVGDDKRMEFDLT